MDEFVRRVAKVRVGDPLDEKTELGPLATAAIRDELDQQVQRSVKAGARVLTPYSLEAAVMNGVDPAPQSVALQKELLTRRKVKVLLYNQQVTDSLTQTWLKAAKAHGIPVVGLYETMPAGGYDYQSWMVAAVTALENAIAHGTSTERL